MKIDYINEVKRMFDRTLSYARNYVRENAVNLRREYGSRYLAIALEEGVVDSDEERVKLIRRLQSKKDERPIVIDCLENLLKPKVENN